MPASQSPPAAPSIAEAFGPLLSPDDLPRAARAALERAGVSQGDAAADLGRSPQAVSMALSDSRSRGTGICLAILEKYGGVRVNGPVYQLSPVDSE